MARLLIPLLFMSLISVLVAEEHHHRDRGHGCHFLFGRNDHKCLSYCLSKNFCTGSCGTSSHSNLTDSVHSISIKNWCHCYRGESGCHCSPDEGKSSPLEVRRTMSGICVGNETGHDDLSQKCQKACTKDGYCFGTCFDIKKKGDKSLSTDICTCYRGPAGCCSSPRLRRGLIDSLFGRNSSTETVSTSSSVPSSSTSSSPSSSSSSSGHQHIVGHSLYERSIPDMINSTIEWMSNHSLGHQQPSSNSNSTTSSPSSSPASSSSSSTSSSTTPQTLDSEADVQSSGLRTESSLPQYIPPIRAIQRPFMHKSHDESIHSKKGYEKPCFYHPMTTTSSSTLKPTPARDILCLRNGIPIYVGENKDSLCFNVLTPETAEEIKPSHEKEDLFKKPFELFKPAKI